MFDKELSYRTKDIFRLLFGAFALFVSFSFLSFDVNDIPWLTTELNRPLQNYTGVVGAYMAFYGRFLFGDAIWAIPLLLVCWVINSTKINTYGEIYKEFLGAFFVLLTLSAMLSLHEDSLSSFLFKGGLVGPQIAGLFMSSFSYLGSILILGLFLILSLALATEFLMVSAVVIGGCYLVQGLHKAGTWLVSKMKWLRLRRRASTEEDEEEYEYEYKEERHVEKESEEENKEEIAPTEKPWLRIVKPVKKKTKQKRKPPKLEFYDGELPPINLLETSEGTTDDGQKRTENIEETTRILGETLKSFDIVAEVVAVNQGPVITVYEVQPAPGVKINRIVNLSNDIALSLSAPSVRIVAPIPGKSVIGIEIPNKFPEKVYFRDLIESDEFQDATSKLSIVLGKDVAGDPMVNALETMPHLLIAGSTGSGKTVCLNALIMSVLYKSSPDEVKMIMVDPKMVEMTFYNGIPHLLTPVITNPRKAADALIWVVSEMERRYEHFSDVGVRNITGYHKRFENSKDKTYKSKNGEEKSLEKMPYIVVFIDELADLMMTVAQDVETSICRLAQLSRAVGIHLIIATQRPSVNVLTGLIKSNLPCRISFRVASSIDSRTILDSKGAEKLIGKGDMLFIPPGLSSMLRAQGCFLADEEIRDVVDFLKKQREPEFVNIFASAKAVIESSDRDDLYEKAVRLVIESEQASASFLQRRMRIGYNRASRLIDAMEEEGIISASCGSKSRKVLVDSYDFSVDNFLKSAEADYDAYDNDPGKTDEEKPEYEK